MTDAIRPMRKDDAKAVAELHRLRIAAGFLSSLGPAFLRQIYAAIPSCPSGFGYVRDEGDGEVVGFIACAESTGRLYRQALLRRGLRMALPLARFIIRPSVIRRVWETLRYPSRAPASLPAAEMLSMAVAAGAARKGIGKALMTAALQEFARRGITRVKLAVGGNNPAAARFYVDCGYRLALQTTHHGLPMDIYVFDGADADRTA